MTGTNAPAQQAAGPHFEHHQCLEVACTECGENFGEDAALHFASVAQALTAIAGSGWEITDDAVLCYHCTDHPDHAASAPAVVHKCEYCWPPLFSEAPTPAQCQCARINTAVAHVQIPFISRAHPGFTTRHCVALSCGECGQPAGGDDEYDPHYSSTERALADAAKDYDWLVTDVLVCCPRCAGRRQCSATGHRFPEHPDYITADGIEVRWCTSCDETVRNPVHDRGQPWL